jgi:DNA-binding GntR family transcriptional regulator
MFWREDVVPLTLREQNSRTPSQRRFLAILHIIRKRITLLRYPPETLLDIDALAAEFKVSRTPIRSVLQQLIYCGLVLSKHGVRTSVAPIDFERLREDFALRSHLAELIGVLSPLVPSKGAIDYLAQAIEECGELIAHPDLESFARIDMKVHEAICSLIGNRQLRQVYDDLYFRTARVWFYFLPKLDWLNEVTIFRQDIDARLDVMKRQDTKAVGFLTRNAISAVLIRVDPLISEVEMTQDPGEPRLIVSQKGV